MLALKEGYIGLLLQLMCHGDKQTLGEIGNVLGEVNGVHKFIGSS